MLLGRRAAAHRAVLGVVTALTVATCAVAGCLTVLVTAAQDHALGTAVAALDDDDLALQAALELPTETRGAEPDAASRIAAQTLAELAAPLPVDVTTWPQSVLLRIGSSFHDPRAYLATVPDPALVELVEGTIPGPDAPVEEDGAIPVAVPEAARSMLGWEPGDRVELDDGGVTVRVTGVYEPQGRPSDWPGDELRGAGYVRAFPLAEYLDQVIVPVWGPLLAPKDVMLDRTAVDVGKVLVTAHPDASALTNAAAGEVTVGLADAPAVLRAALGAKVENSTLDSGLGESLHGVEARLAVTRVGILAVGLVALVLGGAAVLLAARLLTEQRDLERSLQSSRGTSRRQHVLLAAAEAGGIAAVAVAVAPWLGASGAVVVSGWVAVGSGGLGVRAALAEPALWWASAACCLALVVLLVAPTLRQADDDASAIARPAATGTLRAVLSRSAGVVALLVVAAVSVWQLTSRGTVASGTRTDPVLVLAPALLVLACALLVVQALPLVARVTDRVAARSRGLVLPLASWESGRRPARAAGAVLVVTLAVATGAFSLATLATWRASQSAQAALAVGAPLRLDDVAGDSVDAVAGTVRALEADHPVDLQPVTLRSVDVSAPLGAEHGVTMLGTDDASVLRGRLEPVAGLQGDEGWGDVVERLRTPGAAMSRGVPLPDDAVSLGATVDARTGVSLDTAVTVTAIVEDERGVRSVHELTSVLPYLAPAEAVKTVREHGGARGSLRLVGLQVFATPAALPLADDDTGPIQSTTLDVTVSGLFTADADGHRTPLPWGGDWLARTAPESISMAAESGASDAGHQWELDTETKGDAVTFTQIIQNFLFRTYGSSYDAAPADDGAFPGTEEGGFVHPVPVVVDSALATTTEVGVGDRLDLGGPAGVRLEVVGVVRRLPGAPGPAVLVRRDALQAAEAARGVLPLPPDSWWATVPDAAIPALSVAALPVAQLQTVAELRTDLRDGADRVGLQVALWVAAFAAVLMAGAGTATTMVAGLRHRRVELARLQALGIPRRALVRAALAEHGLLAGVGLLAGTATGLLTSALVTRRLAVAPDGGPPVPEPILHLPWGRLGVLLAALVLLVAGTAVGTARLHVGRARSELLRLGADR